MANESVPIHIELRCGKCGVKALVAKPDISDDSIVTCTNCGVEVGRWADVRQQITKAAADDLKEHVEDLLRKRRDST